MIWILIMIFLFVLSIIFFIKSDDMYDKSMIFVPFITSIVILAVFLGCRFDWYKDYEELKIASLNIENKIKAINVMKETYYNPPKNIQFNLDMVNKDLTKQINEKISKLTEYLNNYNLKTKQWNVHYRYRFWNACPFELKENEFPVLKLSNFDL
jgi:hypothetical protein